MPSPNRFLRTISPLAALLIASACSLPAFMSFPPQVRGNMVDEGQLKELIPGTSSKADATSLIGSPTARATFDDNQWIYIAEVTQPVIGGTTSVSKQQVVVLTFDDKGILQNIERKTKADALPVSVVARTTPSPGSEATFLQQLLGNVGRFNPGIPGGGSGGSQGSGGGGLSGGGTR